MNCAEIKSVLVVAPRSRSREVDSSEHEIGWRLLGWTLSLSVSAVSWILIGAAVSHLLR